LTIVALGDSTASGEGSGDYTADTNGLNGNWCHRSPNATVYQTAAPGIESKIDLACSGAPSGQVALGDVKQWTEPSQAQRLGELTKTNRVAAVVVAIGANDDPHFSALVTDCVKAWFNPHDPPCSEKIKNTWQNQVDAMVPKVVNALGDVKKVLADAGYTPADYQLVVQSYAAPIGPDIPESLRNLNGCPFRTEDLYWVGRYGVEMLASGIQQAAKQAGARYLDLSRAGLGHEACSGGPDPAREWFSRLTLQLQDLSQEARASHALQESFHPNAAGYVEFARCLTEFLAAGNGNAACLPGADGNLHAAPEVTVR
jgi:lysophospholipase L1-like esterase